MQNVQNAEIQQRVINLVELYRTKVGKESQIAKEAKDDCEYWDMESVDMMIEEGLSIGGGIYGEGPHTEVWIKHLMVNEQLLGHFYSEVAGENAETVVLDQLLPDVYDKNIFTEEEENFLKSHFKEMVNYIILTPCDDSLKWVHRHDGKDAFTIPSEVLELISSRVEMAPGSKVYYPNTAFAQLANLFEGSTFYVDTMFYAWTRVAIYANSVDAEKLDDNSMPQSCDAIVSYLPTISEDSETIKHICEAYNNLIPGGKLILLCPSGLLVEDTNSSYRKTLTETLKFKDVSFIQEELDTHKVAENICATFRRILVEGQAIKEIIQLPQIMSSNASSSTYCLLIAEKGRADSDVTLIDARTASIDIDTEHYMLSFDMAKFVAILKNDGKDPNTGLRKVVRVSSENLSQHLLVPEVYTIERPSETEQPVPLSSLCTLEYTLVRDVQFDLPEDTPWVTISDLTPLFTGDLNMSDIRKADCPNNPPFVEGSKDYAFGKDGKFVDSIWVQMNTKKGNHVLNYRQCTFLDGNTDAVLYERSDKHGVQVAVVRAMGKPYAVSKGILVFCPKNGIDANSLAALLRLPIVYRQLVAYEKYGVGIHLDDVLAPTDKRVIEDELSRMKKEESVTNELGDKVLAMKTEYINEVRMRKHDMGQKVFDLINTEDLMRYYVENRETESDAWSQIEEQLDHFRSTIHELSEMLDHLSQEEQFGNPELLDLNDYLANLQHSNNVNGFTLSYQLDRDSLLDLQLSRMKDKNMGMVKVIPTIFMAKNDFQRIVSNILSNAQKHGFVDPNRMDYEVNIRLEFNVEKGMYQIDFRNNGKPLPEGLNKMRYGIKGEKAGKTAGTGLGGSVVKSIIEHYKGDYDVFMDGDWTVIRIYLPIAI